MKNRPRDKKTKQPLLPRAQPGYYPGQASLDQVEHWDEATRKLIEKRVGDPPALRFFSSSEAKLMQAILDLVMPQTDRDENHQIPLLPAIDQRLFEGKFDGYIFEGTTEDDEAHRLALAAIDNVAKTKYSANFVDLQMTEQEAILDSIRRGEPGPGWNCGPKVPATHYWNVLIKDAVSAYYSHPFAWDEVGFGGPAYPRGYMRTVEGLPEPWEADEVRYEWLAPEDSISDELHDNDQLFSGHGQTGQAGTH